MDAVAHLSRLAGLATTRRLMDARLGYGSLDVSTAAAALFRRRVADAPRIVGLLGGASAGKSTLFNTLVCAEVSRVSARAHETRGALLAIPEGLSRQFAHWHEQGLLFAGLDLADSAVAGPSSGDVAALRVYRHSQSDLEGQLILDLPDATTKSSAEEGWVARGLLPWLDTILVVIDEERRFDAELFEESLESVRPLGPAIYVVDNHTEPAAAGGAEQQAALAARSRDVGASDFAVSAFVPGTGYRPMAAGLRERVVGWLQDASARDRSVALEAELSRRCAAVAARNLERAEAYEALCDRANQELVRLTEETSLSFDLLAPAERQWLGFGRDWVPLLDVARLVRARVARLRDGLTGRSEPAPDLAFDKRSEELATVLERNFALRFQRASERLERLIADDRYLEADASAAAEAWSGRWELPRFDAASWAARIRAQIDAWQAEAAQQGRRSDLASLGVGTPLLLADLMFLGGAGLTTTWAGLWLAGFVGGKVVTAKVQRSTAFREYQTTVRSYQGVLREALAAQLRENLDRLPARHLPLSDPVMESVLYWSSPERRGGAR